MGSSTQEQFEGVPAGRAHPFHRARLLVRDTADPATDRTAVRLHRPCRWCHQVSGPTGLPPHQYRGHATPGACPQGLADARRAFRLYQQSQHHGRHPRGAALHRDPRERHATTQYRLRQEQARGRAMAGRQQQPPRCQRPTAAALRHPPSYGSLWSSRT